MDGTLALVAVVALLLGACGGWLERGRRCRRAHAHLATRYEHGDLEAFLGPDLEPDAAPDPQPDAAPDPQSERQARPVPAAGPEPAPVAGVVEIRPGSFPGSALPGPGGCAPGPAYVVKAKLRSRIYHTTASSSYAKTIAEVWFRTPEDAEAAGFRAPRQAGRATPTP